MPPRLVVLRASLTDGAYLRAWPAAGFAVPIAALLAGVVAGWRPWSDDGFIRADLTYSSSITIMVVLAAFGFIGAANGIWCLIGYVAADLLLREHLPRFRSGSYLDDILTTYPPLLLAYLLLAALVVLIPLLSARMGRQMVARIRLDKASRPPAVLAAAASALVAAVLVWSWNHTLPTLIRPVYTWPGGTPPTSAIAPIQETGWLVVVTAVVVTVVRTLLEDAARAPGRASADDLIGPGPPAMANAGLAPAADGRHHVRPFRTVHGVLACRRVRRGVRRRPAGPGSPQRPGRLGPVDEPGAGGAPPGRGGWRQLPGGRGGGRLTVAQYPDLPADSHERSRVVAAVRDPRAQRHGAHGTHREASVMSPRNRHRLGIVLATMVLATIPSPAYADNCGGLTDCYGTIAAAIAVVVAIALLIAIIAFLPEILAALGLAAEVAEGAAVVDLAAAATEAGFAAEEVGILAEANGILGSEAFASIAEAHAAGESAIVNIGGRIIQYEPGLNASGMTMFGENGFLIGNEAFASEGELAKTVLHELFRLGTSTVPESGVTAATATAETQAAAGFAERAFEFLKGLGLL